MTPSDGKEFKNALEKIKANAPALKIKVLNKGYDVLAVKIILQSDYENNPDLYIDDIHKLFGDDTEMVAMYDVQSEKTGSCSIDNLWKLLSDQKDDVDYYAITVNQFEFKGTYVCGVCDGNPDSEYMLLGPFTKEMKQELLDNMDDADIIKSAGIDTSFASSIFNGNPSLVN